MRKASIRQNHKDFEENLKVLDEVAEQIVKRQIELDLKGSDALAEGVVLLLAGYWEQVVDEDFVDALNRDTSQYAKSVGIDLPKNLSRDVCFGLLIGDGYLDFRGTEDIIRKSKNSLVDKYNPFNHLTKTIKTSIDQFYVLRNYLAHRSDRARRRYYKMLKEDFEYSKVPRPGVFLRATGNSLNKARLEYFLYRFREASQAIRKKAPF